MNTQTYTIKYKGGCPGDTWEDRTEIDATSIIEAASIATDEVVKQPVNDCDYLTVITSIELKSTNH